MSVPELEIDSFVRSIGVNRTSPHAFFLGAGTSISSGVPSAANCIWQWKRSIFCTNNVGLEEQVSELSLQSVQERIDRWLTVNGYLPDDGQDEYCYLIERCLPIADDRRRFFGPWIREARPHVGYRLLCLLASSQLVDSVWTTNFDGLVARAAADFDITPVEVGVDSTERVVRQPERQQLLCVSLHGDYRYDDLKNTDGELQQQEAELQAALGQTLKTHSLVVAGYSGRDPSVMDALQKGILQDDAQGKIYWCGFSDKPAPAVEQLLLAAKEKNREAYFVGGVSFDDMMARLALHCLEGDAIQKAKDLLKEHGGQQSSRTAFSIPNGPVTGVIKSNAWPLRCPAEMFEFQLTKWPNEKVWRWLEEKTSGHRVVAVPFKKVLALGTLDGIRDAFGDLIDGEILRVPISAGDLRFEDGAVMNLIRQALVRAIAEKHHLSTDGSRIIWKPSKDQTVREGSYAFAVHQAARLSLRRAGEQIYVSIDPTVHLEGETEDNSDAARNARMRILGYQHNDKFNAALNDWRHVLFTRNAPTDFDFPSGSGAFTFTVKSAPAFAALRTPKKPTVSLPENFSRMLHHDGIEVTEPFLRFARTQNNYTRDTLPLRGLSKNGPYDLSLTLPGDDNRIKVAVLCPKAESGMLEQFLVDASTTHRPQRGANEEYLVDFQGFDSIFRSHIAMPSRGDGLWYHLPDIDSGKNEREGSLELSRNIREGITSIASKGRAVILVFTPERWRKWRGFKNDDEVFDVHDFVKAYCVQEGIATQFLDQNTLAYQDKCRVWWWLSVALYAKSMRTPWVLDGLDPNSAFVGLGYAMNQRAEKGKHIVLGCSHIYNAQGQGLQFRLSRIENPIISGGNPFLTFEDARRLGESIRTLFWESHLRLPERVVIHKQTPFRYDEQEGLRAGLEGVSNLELLEINFEASLRYISSQPKGKSFVENRFPVKRGTTVKMSSNEALLWVHGSTEAAKANWTYFQGKRRIPGPIVVRRYAGSSDLATIAHEILGLSKMDWNSGDLYGKLPATIQSSKRIARIGTLLDRFANASFDYRLFM